MQHGDDRALLLLPAADHGHQVGYGLAVDGGERLIQKHEVSVLQQQPREQHALELADRQRVDRSALEARESDRINGMLRVVQVGRLGRPEAAEARPAAEQDGVEHRDREGAVDLGLLRQVGDALGRALDATFDPRREAEQGLEQCALAGAVRADDRRHLGGRNLGRHVMDRRVAVVAHGQVGEAKRGVHRGT